MRLRLQPYQRGSRSARALSEATGIPRVRLVRTRFRPQPEDRVINWGSSELLFPDAVYVNNPANVKAAINKLTSLTLMRDSDVSVPPFTVRKEQAARWLEEGRTVLARTLLRANSGRGIIVLEPEEMLSQELPDAPLYVQYVPKFDEYRVHVFNGQVIDVQQKRRRNNEQADPRIRNSGNGWVFCRQEVNPPEVVTTEGLKSVKALGLDFGAVDIGYTRRSSTATVYEVNTAPGLEGTTLRHYGHAINTAYPRR